MLRRPLHDGPLSDSEPKGNLINSATYRGQQMEGEAEKQGRFLKIHIWSIRLDSKPTWLTSKQSKPRVKFSTNANILFEKWPEVKTRGRKSYESREGK